jgi:hypothetical protein
MKHTFHVLGLTENLKYEINISCNINFGASTAKNIFC